MPNVLDEILEHKRLEVERLHAEWPLERLHAMPAYATPPRNFFAAVAVPRRRTPNLIAEVKRASPSAGLIAADFDPVAIARRYADAGAQALSVLTDRRFFDGRLEYIEQIRDEVGLPVLRKDFLIDPHQIHQSRAFGADAVLLIAEALEPRRLCELVALARELGLCVLLEVHSRQTLIGALRAVPPELRDCMLLGINNRDLATQRVDLTTTERVADVVPPGLPIVAESGIRTRRDVRQMFDAGARAVLVGEALMRSRDVGAAVRSLFPESAD